MNLIFHPTILWWSAARLLGLIVINEDDHEDYHLNPVQDFGL